MPHKHKHLSRLWSGATAALLLLATATPLLADTYSLHSLTSTGRNVALHIYRDTDRNGELGPDEPGLPDYSVTLTYLDGDTVTGQDAYQTDANGYIDFGELAPGWYALDLPVAVIGFEVQAAQPGRRLEVGLLSEDVIQAGHFVWLPAIEN